jgi:hypothetical protein
MAFRLGVSKDKIEGAIALPAGIYDLKLASFKPKFSKPNPQNPGAPLSLNLNAMMVVVNNPQYDGSNGERASAVFEGLNQNAGWIMLDFCHAFGLPLETDGNEYWLPGSWDSDASFDPNNAETYKYVGPLLGRTCRVEVGIETYNGKDTNKVRRYLCAIDDCATKFPEIKHREDLLKKSS